MTSATESIPAAVARLERELDQRLRRLALSESKLAARETLEDLRQQMGAAGLGRLGLALGSGGDKQVHMRSDGGWSASGWVFIRSRSPRTVGAIKSYTEGAAIAPRRGRWLWIPTDEAYRVVGLPPGSDAKKARLEPRLWDRTLGLKFGPLRVIKSVNARPLLIIDNPASVSASGKRGTLKPLLKNGRAPKGNVIKEFIVMFIAIPNTSRAARVDPRQIARVHQERLTRRFASALAGGAV